MKYVFFKKNDVNIIFKKFSASKLKTSKTNMKKFTIISIIFIAFAINVNSQIPNNGFESLNGWFVGNGTLSTDHYPLNVGNYSIKLENQLPLINQFSYGFAVTGTVGSGCVPAFPIIGHPTSLCGYYKCFPLNNDTVQIGLMMFKNGVWVAGAQLTETATVPNWTSFCVPISPYIDADSATVTVAAFFNDTTCGFPYGPFGNSVLYVDNISFDNLITAVNKQKVENFTINVFPNPASDLLHLNVVDNRNNADFKLNIYSVTGSLIKTEILKNNHNQINVCDLHNGLYFIEINSNKYSVIQKLIIQK